MAVLGWAGLAPAPTWATITVSCQATLNGVDVVPSRAATRTTRFDASLARVFEQTVGLPSTPGPEVVVRPGVRGRLVELTLIAHEEPTCGGVAELEIGVT